MLSHDFEALFRFFFFFLVGFQGFKILRFEDLVAIETFHVVYAVSSSDNLRAGVFTNGLHNTKEQMSFILTGRESLSRPTGSIRRLRVNYAEPAFHLGHAAIRGGIPSRNAGKDAGVAP